MELFEHLNPDEGGWKRWREEQAAWQKQVSDLWILPVGKRARVRLLGLRDEFEGILQVTEKPAKLDARIPLQLRIGRMTFSSREIEAWTLLRE